MTRHSKHSNLPRLTLLALAMAALATSGAIAETIHVPADQPSIQAGIDAAAHGDVIVVATGVYAELINFNGKAITVQSSDPADESVVAATIIDGSASGTVVTCVNGEGPDSVLSGLTITNGRAPSGGGMLNSGTSPTVTNCVFLGNESFNGGGGGMYNTNSSPTIHGCSFIGNTATGFNDRGGGIWNYNNSVVTLTNCTFSGNIAENASGGGAIANLVTSTLNISGCTFESNVADSGGGAIENSGTLIIDDSVFSGNTASWTGGAVAVHNGSLALTGSTFNENRSGTSLPASGGGAVYIGVPSGQPSINVSLVDCTFNANVSEAGPGGAIGCIDGSLTITNCMFTGNAASSSGGAVSVAPGEFSETASALFTNCTFAKNTGTSGGGVSLLGVSVDMHHSTFDNNVAESGVGGGLQLDSSDVFFLGPCSFTGNVAMNGDGGGLHIVNSAGELANCTFSGNSASGSGGGMFNSIDAAPTCYICTFSGNSADGGLGGGMFNAEGSVARLVAVGFCENTPDAAAGDFLDLGGNDLENCATAPSPTGACCINDGCIVATELDCVAAGGFYAGDGTTCADAGCPEGCDGDVNGDGFVDVQDLLSVLAAWGMCG